MAESWLWVATEVALAAHAEQLAEHGGAQGVRDMGALESAMVRPRNLAQYEAPDAAALAAAYAFGIARNHPFVDGNKRTAQVCYRTFLALNEAEFAASDEEKYAQMVGLAAGDITEAAFADWLRGRPTLRGRNAVHEARAD